MDNTTGYRGGYSNLNALPLYLYAAFRALAPRQLFFSRRYTLGPRFHNLLQIPQMLLPATLVRFHKLRPLFGGEHAPAFFG